MNPGHSIRSAKCSSLYQRLYAASSIAGSMSIIATSSVRTPSITSAPLPHWSLAAERRGILPGHPAEDRAAREPRATRIVLVEESAKDLARGEEARDRSLGLIEDGAVRVHADPTVGEGDAGGHRVRDERLPLEAEGPVRLVRSEAGGTLFVAPAPGE